MLNSYHDMTSISSSRGYLQQHDDTNAGSADLFYYYNVIFVPKIIECCCNINLKEFSTVLELAL